MSTRTALAVFWLISGLAYTGCARHSLPDRQLSPPSENPPLVRFGLMTPTDAARYDDIARAWREAERLGWDSAWLNDHFMPVWGNKDANQYEAWTLLAALASQTKRVRIGVLVTGNTYRNPALLGKMAATVDEISRGRLELGLGAGWYAREHEAYGFPFGTPRERANRLEEALIVLHKLFSEDHPSFAGRYYRLHKAPFAPRGAQVPRPPIVVGGQGKRWIVPLVARYGDAWNAPVEVDAAGFRERVALIQRECARIGRGDCPRRFSKLFPLVRMTRIPLAGPAIRLAAQVMPGVERATARHLLAGSPDEIARQILEFVDAGCNEVIVAFLPPFSTDVLREFSEQVIPRVRGARHR